MRKTLIVSTLFQILFYEGASDEQRKCRIKGEVLEPSVFDIYSCGKCYTYLFHKRKARIKDYQLFILDNGKINAYLPDSTNASAVQSICSTLTQEECQRWLSCCNAAYACCIKQVSYPPENNSTCGRTWDGWGCWDDSLSGSQNYLACPLFIPHSLPTRFAVKTCMSNGSWLIKDGNYWTDYKPCLSYNDLKIALFLGLACSIVSIVTLLPSLFVFFRYKSLRKQHRIRLHINLFISLIMKEAMTLLWDMLVTYDRISQDNALDTVLVQNYGSCKVLSFLKIYFKSSSFTWMFCEGFYLHRLMSNAFSPPRSLVTLYVAGWGMPLVSSSVYAILRVLYANESCWSKSFEDKEWIFDAPNLVCLVVNLIFLCDILRILLTQLQSHPNEPSNFRRAVKATFILIPLFGVQLFVTIYRIPTSKPGGLDYERFSILISNLQGFFVSLIFCFLNGEVITNLKRSWNRRFGDRYHFALKFETSTHQTVSRSEADFSPNTEAFSLRTTSLKQIENEASSGIELSNGNAYIMGIDTNEDAPLTLYKN